MTQDKMRASQEAFSMINTLASLCATQGVDQKTQELANEQIRELIISIVKPSVLEVKSTYIGLITK